MFVGDGRLAIFPLSQSSACANLLHAAAEARPAMVALNEKNSETGRAPVNYGIGGDMQGSIGSRTRLDLTVIGPAVNRVRVSKPSLNNWENGATRPARSPTSSNRRRLLDQASMKNRTIMQQPSA